MSEQKSRAEYNVGPLPTNDEVAEELRAREKQLEREQARAELKAQLQAHLQAMLGGGDNDRRESDGPFMFTVWLPLGGSKQGQEDATPDPRDTMIEYLREENRRLAAQASDDWTRHAAALNLAHAKGMIEAAGDVYAILNRIVAAVSMLADGD